MKKNDLKDGMVIYTSLDSGVIFNGRVFWLMKDDWNIIKGHTMALDGWDNNLECIVEFVSCDKSEYNIEKVDYMGKTIWKKKEYVTFDEARKSGK